MKKLSLLCLLGILAIGLNGATQEYSTPSEEAKELVYSAYRGPNSITQFWSQEQKYRVATEAAKVKTKNDLYQFKIHLMHEIAKPIGKEFFKSNNPERNKKIIEDESERLLGHRY